jgi:hypothetical protein
LGATSLSLSAANQPQIAARATNLGKEIGNLRHISISASSASQSAWGVCPFLQRHNSATVGKPVGVWQNFDLRGQRVAHANARGPPLAGFSVDEVPAHDRVGDAPTDGALVEPKLLGNFGHRYLVLAEPLDNRDDLPRLSLHSDVDTLGE